MGRDRPKIIGRFWTVLRTIGLSSLTWLAGSALPVYANTNEPVALHVHILYPPNAVTNLVAAPVGAVNGDVQLTWTAPANLNGMPLDHYAVRFATFPAVSPAQADTWWTNVSGNERILGPPHAAGVQEFETISGLALNVTFYFGIKAIDVDGMYSPIDTRVGLSSQAASQPVNTNGAPGTPTGFAGVALGTTSVSWSWNATLNASFYTLYAYPSGAFIAQTNSLTYTESGFAPNTGVSRTLRAGNINGQSSPTTAQTIYTLAAAPINLSSSNVTFAAATLAWQNNGNAAGTSYRLERSLDDVSFAPVVSQTNLSYTDSSLSEETTYYYRVKAFNGDGVATANTASLKVVTLKKTDLIAPDVPMGLKGALDASGRAFTLIWEKVTQNADLTPITDLAGYNIYRKTTTSGAGIKLNTVPITVTAYADQVDNQVFYYVVRAVDHTGNESTDSLIADSSRLANIIFLATDTITNMAMPSSVNSLLRSSNNKYNVPLTIGMREEAIPANTDIMRTVTFFLQRGDTHEAVTDLSFAVPDTVVSVAYNLVNGDVGPGAPGGLGFTGRSFGGASPNKLSMYWNNGVTWVKVGGTVDTVAQAVKIKTSFLGSYQLRMSGASPTLNLNDGNVYPRLFTPNGDGHNDRVYFVLENPNNSGVTGEIYDLSGRHVSSLKPPANNAGIGTTLIWDGKDSNGNVVPAGAYIYKVSGEGKTFTGTVAVAR